MNYSFLIKQSLVYPLKRKEIFLFGLIIATLTGLFTYLNVFSERENNVYGFLDNKNYNLEQTIDSLDYEVQDVLGISTDQINPNVPLTDSVDVMFPIIVLLCGVCGIFVIFYMIAVLYLSNVSSAAIIKSVQMDSGGVVTSFKSSWFAGRKYWVRFAIMDIVLSVIVVGIILISAIIAIPFFSIGDDAIPVFVLICCCSLPFLLLFSVIYYTIDKLTRVDIVLEDKGIVDALKRSIYLIKKNISAVIIATIIVFFVLMSVQFVTFTLVVVQEILLSAMESVDFALSAVSVVVRLFTNFIILLPVSGYLTAFSGVFMSLFMIEILKKEGEGFKIDEKIADSINS